MCGGCCAHCPQVVTEVFACFAGADLTEMQHNGITLALCSVVLVIDEVRKMEDLVVLGSRRLLARSPDVPAAIGAGVLEAL